MAAIKPITPITIDDLDSEVEICRDERCPIIEIHAAHEVMSFRGRAPKSCPVCFQAIPPGQGPKCLACGWDRMQPIYGRKKGKRDA